MRTPSLAPRLLLRPLLREYLRLLGADVPLGEGGVRLDETPDPREWADAGFRDVFASPGLKLAEWPEKAEGLLPVPDLRVDIEPLEGETRRVTLAACTPLGLELLA